jgi:SAM-dependent methyltransferase
MVLENGVWTQETADETHQSSPNLAKFLCKFLPKDELVYDFGCGNGYYLGELEKEGFACTGFEGFKLNNFKCKEVIVHDLTKPILVGFMGSVISLEVGEHLPKSAQETFMQTVTNSCNGKLVFSWAEIGQPGLGHINTRDQKEVIADVVNRGFIYLEDLTLQVRKTIEENTSWFQKTLLLFERK